MAIPVLIYGKSGSGKSTSMRNCVGKDFNMINVLNKPMPFRGKIPAVATEDYEKIKKALKGSPAKSFIIDDAGYLIINSFMRNHSSKGAGSAIYSFYNSLADNFWELIQFLANDLPADKIAYVFMHEDMDDNGNIKIKTIGKLLDEKVCIEGQCTIVLRCINNSSEHRFITQSDGNAVSKSPMGMFDELEIDNDLLMVDNTIREYYGIVNEKNQEEK